MRILLISDYGVPSGGAERALLTLRDGLRARGHLVRFFASRARPVPLANAADDTCFGTTSRYRALLQTANPWAARRLGTVMRRFRPEVVHVRLFLTQLSPLILPRLRGVRSLLHVDTYRIVCPTGTKLLPDGSACHEPAGPACYRHGCLPARDWPPLMMQMWLWRRWRNAFDLVVANSHWVRQRLGEDGIRADEVVYNGVPLADPRLPLSDPPTVAFAGRLVPEKGAEVLTRAMAAVVARLPTARLLMAGDGPERARVERLIAELGLSANARIFGHLPRPALEELLAPAWVQAVPSRWEEPFGLAAVEAMMRGTAVVASGWGGLGEIVRDGETGLLTRPGDSQALAAALLRVLESRALAEEMGRAGRRRALAKFSAETFVDRFVELYEGLRA